jgi:hypothetical protein
MMPTMLLAHVPRCWRRAPRCASTRRAGAELRAYLSLGSYSFHWARITCWCLDRIHSASEPSGSRGCIGHVGTYSILSMLPMVMFAVLWRLDTGVASRMRWYTFQVGRKRSLLARSSLLNSLRGAAPCVSRSLLVVGFGSKTPRAGRGEPWPVLGTWSGRGVIRIRPRVVGGSVDLPRLETGK